MNWVNDTIGHRWRGPALAGALLLGVLFFLFPFASGYTTSNLPLGAVLWSLWTTAGADTQDYTYCLLVPVLVAYLVYAQRGPLARAPIRGSTAALGWILLGLLLFWVGSRAGKQYLGEAGVQLLLLGLILWSWGKEVFRLLSFAWVFLIFLWPMPFMDWLVAFPMRMIVSNLAGHVLNLIGIPCIRHGTALLSAPDQAAGLVLGSRFQIDVADPCSGLHSLFPLLMFSAIYSYLFVPRRWQQWVVFVSAVPLILVGNVVRILLLVIGCITLGVPLALGTNADPSLYHEGCGIAVFVVVLGLEWLLAYGLIALDRRQSAISAPLGEGNPGTKPAVSAPTVPDSWALAPGWRTGLVVGLSAVMALIHVLTPNLYLPQETGVVMSLPDTITMPGADAGSSPPDANDVLVGMPASVSDAELTILPKDTEFARKTYGDLLGHNIFFSIVLSGLQQYTIHPPEVCLPAQGWTIGKTEYLTVPLASGHELSVHCLHLRGEVVGGAKDGAPLDALYLYWFVTDGMTTPSYFTRNVWSSWDRIRNNRDHRWAYITVMSPITRSLSPDGLDEEQTKRMLKNFILQAVPTVQKSEMPISAAR